MLLTLTEQKETLHAAALSAGLDVAKEEIHWQDEFVHLNDLKLHFLDWGTQGKRPLLLLHGGMQTAHSWDLVAVALKRDYHVVALDLRGHGDSEWSPDGSYSHVASSRDVFGLVQHLGWDKFALMGLSLGGLVSLSVAAHEPERLSALVIIDVGPELNKVGVGRILNFTQGPAELDSIDDFIKRALEFNPRRQPEQLRYSLTHNLRQLPNGKWTWKYDRRIGKPGGQGEEPVPTRFDDMWEKVSRVQCPTLIVRGGNSDVLPEEVAQRMVDRIPTSRFVTVPDAGHTVPQDNPTGFLAVARPFLEETQLS